MKTAVIAAISTGVAVVAFIGVFVGVGGNQQAEEQTDYQRTLEEGISSKSNQQAGEQTDYEKTLEESVSSESNSPSQPSTPVRTAPEENNCDPSYPTLCILPHSPDLDCGDIPDKNFEVLPPDPHGFDGNNDGIGCEG